MLLFRKSAHAKDLKPLIGEDALETEEKKIWRVNLHLEMSRESLMCEDEASLSVQRRTDMKGRGEEWRREAR